MHKVEIISNVQGIRLDQFLAENVDITRSQIKKMISEKKVMLNSDNKKAGYFLEIGDKIEVFLDDDKELVPQDIDFIILHEDDDIAVISKPQNLVVHPGSGNSDNTLVNGLLYKFPILANRDDKIRPGIVHRLDKDTSGLMIIAKTNSAYHRLVEMFKNKEIEKTYLAIVEGKIEQEGKIYAPIGRSIKNRLMFEVTTLNSKSALTFYKPIEVFKNHTLLEVKLSTGRTHQIRVHMKYINHPILGDPLYGRKNKYNIKSQMLHAYELKFEHPITKLQMHFVDEFPERFSKFLKRSDIWKI